MKRAIVTGANGFIGSWVVKELVHNGVEVIAVIRDKNSNMNAISGFNELKIVYCELSQIQTLTEKIIERDIDVFYHFAWSGSSGAARSDENLQMQNALWTVDSVKVASNLGCKRFVGAGSIMEKEAIAALYRQGYGLRKPYIYAMGKLVAHFMSKAAASELPIEHVWGTITNAYGVGEISPRFINSTLRKIIQNRPLQFTSAYQNYDFIYISDVAKAFYSIGRNGKPFCEYMIGSSEAKPLKEFILELKETLATDKEFYFGDVTFSGTSLPLAYFCTDETEKDTGFKAVIKFTDGVKMTMEWLKTRLKSVSGTCN